MDDVAKLIELVPSVRRRSFPAWHFAMLNDEERNAALKRMVAGLDLGGKTVLEIGTGCGLLALLFAKYGADHVYTCEINGDLAEIACAAIARTAFRDRITIHRKSSAALVHSGNLPRPPDIVFTETLDCGVVGEGFFSIAQDVSRIAGPDTCILPSVIRQFGMLVEAAPLRRLNEVDSPCGFDLSALNVHSTQTYFPVRMGMHDHRPLSRVVRLRDYSYLSCPPPAPVELPIERSGMADGVISWFEARFGSETVSNRPGTTSHWHQAFHPLAARTSVRAKAALQVMVDDDGHVEVSVP